MSQSIAAHFNLAPVRSGASKKLEHQRLCVAGIVDPAELERSNPGKALAPPQSLLAPAARAALAGSASVWRRVRSGLRLWRLYWLRLAVRFAPTEPQRLLALTMGIGVSCGVAAVAFHLSIRLVEHLLIDRATAITGPAGGVAVILTPALGGLACGAALHFLVPAACGSGIPQVRAAFATKGPQIRLRDSIGKFFVGVLQIGSGSSLGREGPTVQICAGIATWLGRVMGISAKNLRRLLPVGAAAGVAAAFNAPIAAVTFTVEEVVGNLDKSVLSGAIVAAALAAVIERSVLGEHPVLEVPPGYGLRHASSLVVYATLGIAAALVSVGFTDSLLRLRQRFAKLQTVPAWARPGVGGAVTGVLAAAALYGLHVRGITGGGYDTLSQALAGKVAIELMLALCLMKAVATVFSYASGGSGGIFAPTLFIGGTLGGAFGELDIRLFHHAPDTVGAFALVGMGAVFAGVIRAPMTSVLIIIEMTSGYSLILPLMVANMTAYVLARRLRPTAVYEALLEQDGIFLHEDAQREPQPHHAARRDRPRRARRLLAGWLARAGDPRDPARAGGLPGEGCVRPDDRDPSPPKRSRSSRTSQRSRCSSTQRT